MNSILHAIQLNHWQISFDDKILSSINSALEDGNILFFPQLSFCLENQEHSLLTEKISDGKAKNISFHLHHDTLQGFNKNLSDDSLLKAMLKRYATQSLAFIHSLLPQYASALEIGRTSFRPVEIAGRISSSYKKDDTRLHVDAFPASPNQGRRILRLFTNINPQQQPRVWHVGQSFKLVAERFLPHIKLPLPGSQFLLKTFRVTKSLRTPYDHFMLKIHDQMKGDDVYQKTVEKQEIAFPAGSSWIVFTDQVSHAALAGQFVLEQTFYLPVEAMQTPEKSPLRILEAILCKKLA